MDYLILIVIVLSVALIAVVALAAVAWSRRRARSRDDLKRVGDDASQASSAASHRAEGDAAWMRLGGGGSM